MHQRVELRACPAPEVATSGRIPTDAERRRMTCCTALVSGPWRWPPSSATFGRPAGPWGSIPRPPTGWRTSSWTAPPPEVLRPRERRPPRMADQTSPLLLQRVVAFALGHPGFGPARIAAELATPSGWDLLSTNGVWRVRAATACPRAPCGMGWCPAPPPRHNRYVLSRRPSGTWTWTTQGSWCSWSAVASAGCPPPRARYGTTPPSLSRAPPPGPLSRSPGATLSHLDQRPGLHRRRRPGQRG